MFDFLKKKDEVFEPEMQALPEAAPTPAEAPRPSPQANIIAEDTRINGPLTTCRDLYVAGAVCGDVACGGELELERGGEIRGTVVAEGDVVIRGLVCGDVEVSGRLIIAATGRVQGDVTAVALVMEEGGELCGRCSTGAPEPVKRVADDASFLDKMVDDDDEQLFTPALAAVPA